jgi:hypothetical protein
MIYISLLSLAFTIFISIKCLDILEIEREKRRESDRRLSVAENKLMVHDARIEVLTGALDLLYASYFREKDAHFTEIIQ